MEMYLEKKEPWIAVLLSILIAGAGHIYCGKTAKGVIFIVIDLILWFTIFGAIIFGIFAIIDSYNLAKDINFQIEQEERRKINGLQKEKIEKEQVAKMKQEQEISADNFIEELKKNHKLFTAEIYSEQEYRSKKDAVINNLATKKISCSIEDFLASLITLKEQKILSIEEINKIKLFVM
jgi:TM2 domain-containing membrane protein YozV